MKYCNDKLNYEHNGIKHITANASLQLNANMNVVAPKRVSIAVKVFITPVVTKFLTFIMSSILAVMSPAG